MQNTYEAFLFAPLIFSGGLLHTKGFASFDRAEIGKKKDGSPNYVIRP